MRAPALAGLIAAPLAAAAGPVHLPAPLDGPRAVVTPVTTATGNRAFIVEELILDSAPDGEVVAMFWLSPNQTGFPEVEPTGPDRFTVRAGCDTCGRTNWRRDYKAARRGGEWVLAGFQEYRTDRLTTGISICDANLLTGRIEITILPPDGTAEQTRTTATSARAMPLSSLTMHYTLPECEALP